jgi:hypothetical protein
MKLLVPNPGLPGAGLLPISLSSCTLSRLLSVAVRGPEQQQFLFIRPSVVVEMKL